MEVGHVPLLEEDDPVGVGQDGSDVGGQEGLAIAQPDDERHVLAGADQPARLGPMHHGHGVRTLGLSQGVADGIGQVARVGLLDEVRQGLGVGLRAKLVAARRQAVAKLLEVLDDAVVDDGDVARAIDVRMRVQVVRPSMRRPARMGEADGRRWRDVEQGGAQVAELAGSLLDEELAVGGHERDAGRVVAAILQARQALEQDGRGLTRPDVADDPTCWLALSRWSGGVSVDARQRGQPTRRRARPRAAGPRPRP